MEYRFCIFFTAENSRLPKLHPTGSWRKPCDAWMPGWSGQPAPRCSARKVWSLGDHLRMTCWCSAGIGGMGMINSYLIIDHSSIAYWAQVRWKRYIPPEFEGYFWRKITRPCGVSFHRNVCLRLFCYFWGIWGAVIPGMGWFDEHYILKKDQLGLESIILFVPYRGQVAKLVEGIRH